MILQNLTHPLNQKQADENVNNSKIKMNVKMYKNGNTVPPSDSHEGFHKVTMPSNVPNYSPKGGTSITEPNPDTTEYHEDKAKMICEMVMQQMQGWQDAR